MIKTWRERLDWGGERSPTGPQIRKAMQAEITELRREMRKQTSRADRNKASAKEWRAHMSRYQKLAAAKPVVEPIPASLRKWAAQEDDETDDWTLGYEAARRWVREVGLKGKT